MKKLHAPFILLVSSMLMLGSCMKDTLDGKLCPDNSQGTTIALSLGEMKVIETRSVASENERYITDAYLLVFGSDGYYKSGEKVAVGTAIADNGEQKPTLTTELPIATGDKVVVLLNTNAAELPATLTAGTSTLNDINSAFPSNTWLFDWTHTETFGTRRIPMCGVMTFGTDTECPMIRAYAKVDLTLAPQSGADKMTGTYASSMTNDNTEWYVYNIVMKKTATIYNPTANTSSHTPLITTIGDFFPSSYLGYYTTGYTGVIPSGRSNLTYLYEFPNATVASVAGEAPIGHPAQWHKDRTCLIVHNTTLGWYRIDFYNHKDGVFMDILRNCHYQVKITRVSSAGYTSADEAFANPSSNIEYEIVVTGDDENYTISNGQYALTLDKDVVTVFGDKSELLKFSLRTNIDFPVNLITAVADVVKADKATVVSIPDDIYLNGVVAVSNKFDLGPISENSYTGDPYLYTLTCSGAFRDNQAAIAALDGCFLRIRLGNITQYVPINVLDVSFYYGTANSMELQPVAGTYSFDCTPYTTTSTTYAYQNTFDPELVYPRSAKMLWSDVASNHVTGATVAQNGDKFTLNYTTTGAVGNAVIGIYDTADPSDANARLLWSYHIWISDRTAATDQHWSTVDYISNPRQILHERYWMMDRNLGATSTVAPTATTLDNVSSFGLLYQWGRKDPFAGSFHYNSSAYKPIYDAAGTAITTRNPTASTAATGTVNYAIGNPTNFITETTEQDWIYGNTYKTDKHKLWGCKTAMYVSPVTVQDDKAIYDPCPAGYKVAPSDAFTMLLRPGQAGISSSGNSVGVHRDLRNTGWNVYDPNDDGSGLKASYPTDNYGIYIYYTDEMSGPVSYFPYTGNINRANGGYSKQAPLIHTNSDLSPNSNYAARCSFNTTSFYSVWYSGRAGGQSVRCVRIE